MSDDRSWRVNEIFNSISGEYSIFGQGRSTTFLRFSGCVTRCLYCDTMHEGYMNNRGVAISNNSVKDIVEMLYSKTRHLLITGGEPLLQPEALTYFVNNFGNTWIETSGLISFKDWIGRVPLVVDKKNPMDLINNTSFVRFDLEEEYSLLGHNDCIKFVISSWDDVVMVKKFMKEIKNDKVTVALSPNYDKVSPRILYEWASNELSIPFILNTQLHKLINLK